MALKKRTSTGTVKNALVQLSNVKETHVVTISGNVMSVDVNMDSDSEKDWIQDEIINKLKETVRKQVTMIMEQRKQITDLEDSISQGEVLQALMRRSRDQVLTVMAQDAHSKGSQTLSTKILSTSSQASSTTKEKGTRSHPY